MLELRNISVQFSGLKAVDSLSMTVEEGSIHSLIGPNGAGKTTTFNAITGVFPPVGGSIHFDGKDLLKLSSSDMIGLGLARTFQNLELYRWMNVYDNIASGYVHRYNRPMYSLFTGNQVEFNKRMKKHIMETADMLGLRRSLYHIPSQLSYGTLKRVELARAIISRPRLLLLDEPAAGLNDEETRELDGILLQLRDVGFSILLVEHDMKLVMKISDRVTVMDFGRKIAEGTPTEIAADEEVIRVYLGETDAQSK